MTLIELLIVVAILGILANVAMPAVLLQLQKARATAMVGDFRFIRDAAMDYYTTNGVYPADVNRGREPPELAPYTKGRVGWVNDRFGYKYDWDYWIRRNGKPKHPNTGVLVGFSVVTRDPHLRALIEEVYDGPLVSRNGRLIFVIEPYG